SRVRALTIALPGYEDMQRAHPDIRVPTPEQFVRMVLYIERFAAMYRRILERLTPRVVYVVCYYGSERFAMLLAAHRLGIQTVDIQHGYSGDLHWGYSRWTNIPPGGGFELLPRYFWCWGEDEFKSMSAWAEKSRGAHHVRTGGNLFANMWR